MQNDLIFSDGVLCIEENDYKDSRRVYDGDPEPRTASTIRLREKKMFLIDRTKTPPCMSEQEYFEWACFNTQVQKNDRADTPCDDCLLCHQIKMNKLGKCNRNG